MGNLPDYVLSLVGYNLKNVINRLTNCDYYPYFCRVVHRKYRFLAQYKINLNVICGVIVFGKLVIASQFSNDPILRQANPKFALTEN